MNVLLWVNERAAIQILLQEESAPLHPSGRGAWKRKTKTATIHRLRFA